MQQLTVTDLVVEFSSGGYAIRPLDGFSCAAHSGELVLLLGPSGCGKTTLLSCLAGILTPTQGKISLDEQEVTGFTTAELTEYRRRSIGIVFQGFKLVPSLTARENVEAPLRLAGVSGKAARARAEELLTRFGLAERLGNRPAKMSGGQQQRVAIARALAHDPPVLIADEPTASLDYIQVESVIRTLRDLASPGRLVIVSTHDHRLVPLADRVIKLGVDTPITAAKPGPVELTEGQVLFEQGDAGELVYVILDGEIDLFRQLADGGEEFIHTCKPGDYFGELAPLLHFPRSATARARTNARLRGCTVQEFRESAGAEGMRRSLGTATPSEPAPAPA